MRTDKIRKRVLAVSMAAVLGGAAVPAPGGPDGLPGEMAIRAQAADVKGEGSGPKVTLRVCNWEEYIDLGDWDEEETIDLESGDIIGVNSMVEDFEAWYLEHYGVEVEVEYSTFGTNEDLYIILQPVSSILPNLYQEPVHYPD